MPRWLLVPHVVAGSAASHKGIWAGNRPSSDLEPAQNLFWEETAGPQQLL